MLAAVRRGRLCHIGASIEHEELVGPDGLDPSRAREARGNGFGTAPRPRQGMAISPARVLLLQRTAGNRATQRLISQRWLLRAVDRDIRTTQVTPEWAQQLRENELRGQIDLARRLLLGMAPDDSAYAALRENLTVLEADATRRFATSPAAPVTSPARSSPRSRPLFNPAVTSGGGLAVAGVVGSFGTGTGTAGAGLSSAAASGALGTATELGVVADTVWVGGTMVGTGTLTAGTGAVVGGTVMAEGTAVAGGAVIAGGAEVAAVTGATVVAAEAGTGVAAAAAAAAGSSVVPVVGWIVAGLIVGGIVIYLVTRDSTPRQAPGASGGAPVSEPSTPPPAVTPPAAEQAPVSDPVPWTPASAPGATNATETLQAAGRRPADLPSWGNVSVDWDHIYDQHWDGTPLAPRAEPRRIGNNDMFNGLSKDAIDALVRAAYAAVDQKLATQGDRIRVRGRAGIWTVEFWVNKATRKVETAYPIFP